LTDSFETTRLYISRLSLPDAAFVLQLYNTEDWLRFIGNRNIGNVEEATAYIKKVSENPAANIWTISEKQTQQRIGILTLIDRDTLEYPDFGFALLPQYYKKGYAFEAAKELLEIIRTTGKDEKLLAISLPENRASIALLEKLQFQFDKLIELNNETLALYSLDW